MNNVTIGDALVGDEDEIGVHGGPLSGTAEDEWEGILGHEELGRISTFFNREAQIPARENEVKRKDANNKEALQGLSRARIWGRWKISRT